ncbi:hypothetical protein Pcinc_003855 [Petrolisthes cinctipes]|uniref:Kinesin-like protein n=1 Tax=Petrolisthes cinctipes TaxID=88211 RepID=A0AAE1GIC4_PETCI|nr:hypothetical protein Pcinc_003855 [Petrolisthes cinctipes]
MLSGATQGVEGGLVELVVWRVEWRSFCSLESGQESHMGWGVEWWSRMDVCRDFMEGSHTDGEVGTEVTQKWEFYAACLELGAGRQVGRLGRSSDRNSCVKSVVCPAAKSSEVTQSSLRGLIYRQMRSPDVAWVTWGSYPVWRQGAMNRATGATAMNAHSSRSHEIFSLHIQQRNSKKEESIVCSKFHLVDLAGSERAKKTGATGVRFKEGVNINKGLLALGNVIAALCEEGNRGHIPYRDSKLTRLLKDSLGGNSHTVMVACVSPADSNLEETLSTLRYADRALKIKNKPIINRDPQAAELARLRQQVSALLSRNKAMEEEIEQLTRALQSVIDENTNMAEKALMAEMSRDRMKVKLEELLAQTGNNYEALNKTLDVTVNPQYEDQLNLVKELQVKIVELQSEQHKGEKAMMDLEISRHSTTTTNTQAALPTDAVKMEDGNTSNEGSPEKETKEFVLDMSHRRTYIQPKTSTKQIRSLELTFSESEEEDIDEDRSQKEDSDWRQTPLFKKISKITVC